MNTNNQNSQPTVPQPSAIPVNPLSSPKIILLIGGLVLVIVVLSSVLITMAVLNTSKTKETVITANSTNQVAPTMQATPAEQTTATAEVRIDDDSKFIVEEYHFLENNVSNVTQPVAIVKLENKGQDQLMRVEVEMQYLDGAGKEVGRSVVTVRYPVAGKQIVLIPSAYEKLKDPQTMVVRAVVPVYSKNYSISKIEDITLPKVTEYVKPEFKTGSYSMLIDYTGLSPELQSAKITSLFYGKDNNLIWAKMSDVETDPKLQLPKQFVAESINVPVDKLGEIKSVISIERLENDTFKIK